MNAWLKITRNGDVFDWARWVKSFKGDVELELSEEDEGEISEVMLGRLANELAQRERLCDGDLVEVVDNETGEHYVIRVDRVYLGYDHTLAYLLESEEVNANQFTAGDPYEDILLLVQEYETRIETATGYEPDRMAIEWWLWLARNAAVFKELECLRKAEAQQELNRLRVELAKYHECVDGHCVLPGGDTHTCCAQVPTMGNKWMIVARTVYHRDEN